MERRLNLPSHLRPWAPYVAFSMGLICAVLNFLFAYRIGLASSKIDGLALGCMAVVVEVFLWVLPFAAVAHHGAGRGGRAMLVWSMWALFAAVSLGNTLGYIATSKEVALRSQQASLTKFVDNDQTIADLRERLSGLTKRSLAEIDGDAKLVALSSDLTARQRKERATELEVERAGAVEAQGIRLKIDSLKLLVSDGRPTPRDPAAALLAERTGISLDDAAFYIAIVFAFAGLIGSSLGPFALSIEEDKPKPAKKQKPKSVPLTPVPAAEVEQIEKTQEIPVPILEDLTQEPYRKPLRLPRF